MALIKLNLLAARLMEKAHQSLDRLDLLLPQKQTPVDWQRVAAAQWQGAELGGQLRPVPEIPTTRLEDVLGLERQKTLVVQNTRQFLLGVPANNVLLTGSRGTGKSSLVQALLNQFFANGLRVIQVDKSELANLPAIVSLVANEPYRFLLFCDDLSFESEDASYKALKTVLDGGLDRAPENVIIYATSNRRHLVPEYEADNEKARNQGTEIHQAEGVEEKISLSDRFGLWLTFYPINQPTYLSIARHWVDQLAAHHQIKIEWNANVDVLCVRWADNRGGRSGRTASQFARHWVGQQLLTAKVVN